MGPLGWTDDAILVGMFSVLIQAKLVVVHLDNRGNI